MIKQAIKSLLPLLWITLSLSSLHAETTRIMLLGDSITYDDTIADHEGTARPSSVRAGYRSHLYYKLADAGYAGNFVGSRVAGEAVVPPFDPDNEGHPGATSYEIGNNVYRYLIQNPADIVLLHIGTNDNDVSVAGVNEILNEIDTYEYHTGRFVRVIVALIIDRQSQSDVLIAGFNHNLDNLLQRRIQGGDAITEVNMYRGAGLTSDDYTDHTHPSSVGYDKMAQVWFDALMAPYNVALHQFPTTLVSRVHLHSVNVDEAANSVTFIADVPDSGITF